MLAALKTLKANALEILWERKISRKPRWIGFKLASILYKFYFSYPIFSSIKVFLLLFYRKNILVLIFYLNHNYYLILNNKHSYWYLRDFVCWFIVCRILLIFYMGLNIHFGVTHNNYLKSAKFNIILPKYRTLFLWINCKY